MAQDIQDIELWQVDMPMILGTAEDTDNAFRTQNEFPTDWERSNVVQRRGPVNVNCSLLDAAHGKLGDDPDMISDDDGALATLLVFHFRFVPQKHCRRIIRAYIHIKFSGVDAQSAPPAVWAIAPHDTWTVVPTTDHEEKKHAMEGNIGSPEAAPLHFGFTTKFEKLRTRDVSDATTVSGSIEFSDDVNYGECNCAAWTLLENQTRKTGVPPSIRTGILLKRENNATFQGMVKIECVADWKSRFESMFAKVPVDDPLLFNPKLQPARPQKKRKYDPESLLRTDVMSVADVTMQTIYKEANKEATK